ncbi:hypothetical protein [Oscillibacter sp.]|uniref:hypothetical protein n=1 Tax=Oscillibacter sp. TaxID=1945593 RepID=UPI0028B14511|nr:hypothetical protein [Oscillibacter sp.]
MATKIKNYQCPACTAPLHFGTASGKLECEYCGSSFDVEGIEQPYVMQEQEEASQSEQKIFTEAAQWSEEEAAHLRTYSCPSCGAEVICDDTTAATSCPYCANPLVVLSQFSGQLRPDYVIPFRINKDAAISALKEHYKGKLFLPKSFKLKNHIQDIKGVYVPFWLYSGKLYGNIKYLASTVQVHRGVDEEITVTKHYQVVRKGTVTFEKVPVDGSSKMPNAHMDAIEPFDYGELKEFSTAYLPGFLADKYDQDAQMCKDRFFSRIKTSTEDAFAATVGGYSRVVKDSETFETINCKATYVLLPVWMLATCWEGKNFLFAINGQTGKLVGDLPMSWLKFWLCFCGISIPLIGLLSATLL